MISTLKPNKANLIGTAALLIANVIAGALARFMISLYIGSTGAPIGNGMNGNGGYNGTGGYGGGYTGGMMRNGGLGSVGILSAAVNYILLAVFFYIIISCIVSKFSGSGASKESSERKSPTKKASADSSANESD